MNSSHATHPAASSAKPLTNRCRIAARIFFWMTSMMRAISSNLSVTPTLLLLSMVNSQSRRVGRSAPSSLRYAGKAE
jgi:hypothetical protein